MRDNGTAEGITQQELHDLNFEFGGLENLPEVMSVMERSFPKEFGESWNNSQCRSMLSLPGTELFLVRFEEHLGGFAICRTILEEEELLMIAVDPQFQRMGVATQLLKNIYKRAEELKVEVIFLEVRSNNPAQLLYQRHGFEKIGVRSSYYTGSDKTKYDANTYRKWLKTGS